MSKVSGTKKRFRPNRKYKKLGNKKGRGIKK